MPCCVPTCSSARARSAPKIAELEFADEGERHDPIEWIIRYPPGRDRRRHLGASVAAVRGMQAMAQTSAQKTFVLVHGAWHGGWCWRRVSDLLESKGHKVFAPTMTGLGERSHLMSKEVVL